MTVRYVRNEEGAVQSVTEEHFQERLHETTNAGRRFLLPGWVELNEDEAREAHPQLFGAADPKITFTDDELIRALQRKRMLAELHGETAPEPKPKSRSAA